MTERHLDVVVTSPAQAKFFSLGALARGLGAVAKPGMQTSSWPSFRAVARPRAWGGLFVMEGNAELDLAPGARRDELAGSGYERACPRTPRIG